MAVEQTQKLPPQYVEDLQKDLGTQLTALTAAPLDTSKFAPQVAGQDQAQKDAYTMATTQGQGIGAFQPYITQAGAYSGPKGYQSFMSPYQQDVIDATLSEFDRQQTIADTARRDQAIAAGAYGGGREGVMAAEAARGAADQRANLQAQLLAQGFQQAQQAAAADLAARQGLGQYQSALGQQQQAVAQAQFDADQIAAREAEFQPFTQLGLVGQQLAQIQPGAFPTQTVGYAPPAAPASPCWNGCSKYRF